MERIIGRYTGDEKGILLIVFGGMHGNEKAGIKALETMFDMLDKEKDVNPGFRYKGRLVGIRGNLKAIEAGTRYIVKDLNRQFTPANVNRVLNASAKEMLDAEDEELRAIIKTVRAEISDYNPEKVVVLDLHTTSATGGIFAIATEDPASLNIAVELHAPVILGLLRGIEGTSSHYFKDENMPVRTISVVFEAGQHEDPDSVNRAIAALTNCMRAIGAVREEDVENRHNEILINYSKGLPKVAELVTVYKIMEESHFEMLPDYKNFQRIKEGELLAFDNGHEVFATEDSLILMPHYQEQGEDGFFLIKKVDY